MINPRQLVRVAVKTALAHATLGFNAKFAALAASYSVDPVAIDFTAGSENFIETYLNPADIDLARFPRNPVGLALYTSLAQQVSGTENAKFRPFDGDAVAHLDFYIVRDGGVDLWEENTENLADAIEDAVLQCIHDPALTYFRGPVYYAGDLQSIRESAIQTEDGYAQRVPFIFQFGVTL